MRTARSALVKWAAILFMATQPIIWLSAFGTGNLGVKPVHLCFVLMAVAGALCWGRSLARWPTGGFSALFSYLYAAIILWCWATLTWSGTPDGLTSNVKDTLYFGMFVITYGIWRNLSDNEKRIIASWGSALGIFAFLLVAEITFIKLGRNFVGDYIKAVATGNVVSLQFDFYPKLFNFVTGATSRKLDADYISTSLRNNLVGAFVVYIFLINAYAGGGTGSKSISRTKLVRYSVTAIAAILVFTAVSRSNWIALLVGGLSVAVAAIFKRRTRIQSGKVISRNTILIRVACVSLALGLASAALTTPLASSVFNIIYSRTSTLQTDNRWGMYSDAMDKISERPIEGYGVATTVLAENFNLQIHNFILAAWFETGIVGMLLSIAVYAVLGFAWLRCMFSTKYTAEPGGPSLIWLCALPVLPLVRLMVAGEGGGVSVVEWLALAIFFAETGRLTNKNRAATNAYIASGPGASASPSIPGPAREIGIIPQTSS